MFGFVNIFQRWIFTVFVVFGTYNPSGLSFVHWSLSVDSNKSIVAVVFVAILAFFVFLARSTWRAMKFVGIALTSSFFTLFAYMLVDIGVVRSVTSSVYQVMFLFVLASTLAVGLSFSAVRARLSGQIDSDDVGTP